MADGIAAWAVFERCVGQVRWTLQSSEAGLTTVPTGLDFTAVLAFAEAMGATSPLLAELLPTIEGILVRSMRGEEPN